MPPPATTTPPPPRKQSAGATTAALRAVFAQALQSVHARVEDHGDYSNVFFRADRKVSLVKLATVSYWTTDGGSTKHVHLAVGADGEHDLRSSLERSLMRDGMLWDVEAAKGWPVEFRERVKHAGRHRWSIITDAPPVVQARWVRSVYDSTAVGSSREQAPLQSSSFSRKRPAPASAPASASVAAAAPAAPPAPPAPAAPPAAGPLPAPVAPAAPAVTTQAVQAAAAAASSAAISLANAQFDTGRPQVPESTLGGETTCIVCFDNPKSHLAVPCAHQCVCGPCSEQLKACPICRAEVQMWLRPRII
mmetsp:Transcript_40689/g.134637  ORF Transcript_40689/g.134637 Transcript_40689/m.134637 type:complete len:306 (+) Transcript_40689:461-1378(+)